jgi:hypothetical protein
MYSTTPTLLDSILHCKVSAPFVRFYSFRKVSRKGHVMVEKKYFPFPFQPFFPTLIGLVFFLQGILLQCF